MNQCSSGVSGAGAAEQQQAERFVASPGDAERDDVKRRILEAASADGACDRRRNAAAGKNTLLAVGEGE